MAKRTGSVNVEYESPERKRLRNAVPVSLTSWAVAPVSDDRRCADNITACLRSIHNDSLNRMMDTAVKLIQDLKLLQSFRTAYARQAFDSLYADVLDYVGRVIDHIKKADRDNIPGSGDEDSALNSFAGVYQYLVEIVAKHAEYSRKSSSNGSEQTTIRDFRLASLPLAFEYSVETALSTTNNSVTPPDFLGISHGPRIQTISRKSLVSSLISVVLSPRAYMDDCIDWTASAFGWCLAQTLDNPLRLAAWSLFPMFCMHAASQHVDGFLAVNSQSRVKVGDPDDLLEVVANSIGYVSCARSGCLRVKTYTNESSNVSSASVCLQWGQSTDLLTVSSYTTGISSLYSCLFCDSRNDTCSAAKKKDISKVSLSGWLPYWFIALNNVPESASVQFVRNVTRFVRHAEVQDISLRTSPLGRGIIRRLSSSNRELRLAAVDTVLSYSTAYPEDTEYIAKIKRVNRIETIYTLQQMVQELSEPRLVEETLELVAGGLGCACGLYDDVLSQVMPFLINYYCGDNIFLRAVAMEQILRITQKHAVSPSRLLSLYSASIACTLANTLDQKSPRPFVHCLQIINNSPKQFLSAHQNIIVPHLVASGNEQALRNVADMLEVRLPVLCVNLAPEVFVKIFLMDDQLMHQALMRFVRLISTGTGGSASSSASHSNSGDVGNDSQSKDQVEVNIPSLLRSCTVKLIYNLVLSLGEEDPVLRKRARSALVTVQDILGNPESDEQQGVTNIVQQSVDNLKDMAKTESPKPGKPQGQTEINVDLADFLSQHILGVMAYVNELLRDTDTAGDGESGEMSALQESSMRRKALRAIGELVILLGSKLTPHTNNIVASLTPSLQGSLAATALRSWIILAESLVKTTLVADQINSLLVPLLTAFFSSADEEARSGAAEAINRIVGLHKRNIKSSCDKVCSIPDHPQLEIAFTIFQGFIGRNSLRQRLSSLLQMLKAKDSAIVFCASRELCTLLQTNEKQITVWKQAFMQDNANIGGTDDGAASGRSKERNTAAADARLLHSISKALKAACSHATGSHRLGRQASASCTACLSVIGIIDSRALENNVRSDSVDPAKAAILPGRVSPTLHNLQDEEERLEFACTLIVDYLVHAFAMAPSPSVQLCAAYSIQELLRLVGFTKSLVQQQNQTTSDSVYGGTKSATRGGRRKNDVGRRATSRVNSAQDERLIQRWCLIPASVQEIISPLLDSKYTIQQSGRKRTDTGAGSRTTCIVRSSSYIGWLRAWTVELVNLLPASSPAAAMFKVCTSAMKESTADMLLFLLPQIAHQYCLSVGSEYVNLCARNDTNNDKPILINDDDDNDDEQNSKNNLSMDIDGPHAASKRHYVSNEIHAVFLPEPDTLSLPGDQWRLCKEVCLDLLDTFSSHVRSQQSARVAGKRSSRKDSQFANTTPEEDALLKLVGSVPHKVVAQVAASCHQYERSVLHTELALRENAFGKHPTLFGNVDDSAIAVIQALYFSMGDVDGVIGASLCRKQVDHKLAIRKYEIEGNWSHALIGHESLLRAQPDNEEYQKSWISCLQKMGQWEGAWATSKELFKLRPNNEDEQQLNAACYAAAWRLGKWSWVQETADMDSARPGSKFQPLPDFNALNSVMLLRLSRDPKLEDLNNLRLPTPLQSLSSASSGIGSGVLSCAAVDLVNLALASIGRGIADSASTNPSFFNNYQLASVSSKTPSDVHAHMVGDISIMASRLANIDVANDCGKLMSELSDLFEQWRRRVACLPAVYSVQEPILMLHSRLFDMLLDHIQAGTGHSRCSQPDGSQEHSSSNGSSTTCRCVDSIMRQKVRTNLQAAQLARIAGFRATAMGILVHSELTCSPTPALRALLQTEHAQILWDEGHSADAMASLVHVTDNLQEQLNIPTISSSTNPDMYSSKSSLSVSNTRAKHKDGALLSDTENAYVRAMFPLLDWQVTTNSLSLPVLIRRYDQILGIQESDKAYYAMGRLHDILFSAVGRMGSRSSKSRQGGWDRQIVILQSGLIRNYLRSILHSSRYLFQALPRLLTVWFDFSTTGPAIPEKPGSDKDMIGHLVKQIDTVITNMTNRLPMYNFLVVLSQLVSRICHDNPNVFKHLQTIILKLLEFYPQQTLWQLMGVQRSTFAVRAQRCQTILDMARSIASGPQKVGVLIEQASRLTDSLLALCNSIPPSRTTTTMHMSRDFQQLAKSTELDLIIPLQQSLVPTLPDTQRNSDDELALSASSVDRALDRNTDSGSGGHNGVSSLSAAHCIMMHQPFLSDLPTISGFENEIEIMMSLQRPKKITMIGSDGKRYSFLCKPKDDLRKDARLMEFNSMINRLLNSNAETHKRGLHIRTYAVVPLNEECGLIQWIAPTTGIRHVLLKLYKAHNVSLSMSQVKNILEKPTLPPAEAFVNTLLPLFPSVMHEWFLQSFPDPPRWLASRANFTRSAAVMSMVGHILGLGDRHCENILLDESTGSVVHVDFNCLFEKGMTLEKPEKVPFRLTHNMVDAMGVTGYEGTFRKTCEMTLNLLRDNRDALMSVLESFLHDPLVEWSRRTTRSSRQAAASTSTKNGVNQPNEQAAKCLNIINRKLQGILQGVAPISVEGQVDALIREATSPDRLFQMYIGWAAYM
ncbi:hypothetical protein FB645_005817 [Coemansia sp. IMI 203386]|nr:hypothetical protein FB645_005817 [Coemansia sp. IMI 203386]